MSAHDLLSKLLDYVLEQDKDVDPRGFRLAGYKGFLRSKPDLQGLPGVHFDIKTEGDHTWLRVARLEASSPPALSDERMTDLIVISDDPNGVPPCVNESVFGQRLVPALQKLPANDRAAFEAKSRSQLSDSLAQYTPLWTAWAEGEKPRRKTINLYGDLFSIKHQLESEETAKPHEMVWGVGVAAWKLAYEDRASKSAVEYQYPLLTQAVELALDETTLALGNR